MKFSNKELNYIVTAVDQFDCEYGVAPDGLVEKLKNWRITYRELCHHTDIKIIDGFLQNDGTTPRWGYCNECGEQYLIGNVKS